MTEQELDDRARKQADDVMEALKLVAIILLICFLGWLM